MKRIVENKKEKGITLVALVITIILIVILASIATYSGIGVINSTKLTKFTTELKIMQTEVNNLYEKRQEEKKAGKEEVTEYGEAITGELETLANKAFNTEVKELLKIENYSGYRYFSTNTIKDLKIEGVEQEVFVNIDTRSVVSCEGIKYEEKMCYILEQLPNGLYNVEYQAQTGEPTFEAEYEQLSESSYKIIINEDTIKYDGNINKWQVKYKLEGENYWNTTEDLSFIVNSNGTYYIKLANENIETSDVNQVILKVDKDVNSPDLKTGMIPVKWNGTTWVKADEKNENNDWYDYSKTSKKWANVVTVKETGTKTRQEYMNASVGEAIAEEDITTMFVWIPRYSYKITNGYHANADGTGEIKIKFLMGTKDKYFGTKGEAKRTNKTDENFVVHPSFTADTSLGGSGEEIRGFWVGKFESSNSTATINNAGLSQTSSSNALYGGGNVTNLNVTIRPNVTSWRNIDANNIFTVCKAMNGNRKHTWFKLRYRYNNDAK